jgi:hypothetical protein
MPYLFVFCHILSIRVYFVAVCSFRLIALICEFMFCYSLVFSRCVYSCRVLHHSCHVVHILLIHGRWFVLSSLLFIYALFTHTLSINYISISCGLFPVSGTVTLLDNLLSANGPGGARGTNLVVHRRSLEPERRSTWSTETASRDRACRALMDGKGCAEIADVDGWHVEEWGVDITDIRGWYAKSHIVDGDAWLIFSE